MAYIKNPTTEQKKVWELKAKEQEQNATSLIKNLAENYKANPLDMAELFEFGSRFYDYSAKNNMLIFSQNRNATYVQSYDAWKKMGYPVQAKERSIKIFVPVQATFLNVADGVSVPLSKASAEQKAAYNAGEITGVSRLLFKLGNVFDISQTNMPKEEYPKMFSMGYSSDLHNDICKGLKDFSQEKLNCEVVENNLNSISLRGLYFPKENKIELNNLLEDTQRLSTLSHELGHALIHRVPSNKSSSQKEFEADAVSIMIQSNYGIELTDSRKQHLADHYNKFKQELLEKVDPEEADKILSEKMDELYASVFSVYRDNIEDINLCVERYVPNEKLINATLDKEENINTELENEANTAKFALKGTASGNNMDFAKSLTNIQNGKKKDSYVQKACDKASEKLKTTQKSPEFEIEK